VADLKKEYLFPTPVYQASLDDHELLNVYLRSRLHSWRQRDRSGLAGGTRGNMGAWQSLHTMHEMSEFRLFTQQIRRCMDAVLQDQEECPAASLWCLAMCATISDRFGYDQSMPEIEGVVDNAWQGIYFVQAPEDSGSIVFLNPRNSAQSNSENSALTQQVHIYDAIAGRVLLFPSWLNYELQPNRSMRKGGEGERISIRFAFGRGTPDAE